MWRRPRKTGGRSGRIPALPYPPVTPAKATTGYPIFLGGTIVENSIVLDMGSTLVCERAFETDMDALYGIPENSITEKMILEVARAKKPWILRYVYKRLNSESLKGFIESLVPDL